MKKILVGLLAAAVGLAASADVNVSSVLNEAAMWLDASSPANFTFDERGGVAVWRNLGAGRTTYGDAVNYKVRELEYVSLLNRTTNCAVRASLQGVFGAPGVDMGVTGSECDYQYERITTIRTVFFVGRLDLSPNGTQKLAPLLGDTKSSHFHRGDHPNSCFWNRGWADDGDGRNIMMTFYKNSASTACNGESTAPSTDQRDIIIVEAADNVESDRLTCDRNTYTRTGGRGINELLIFTRALTAEERTAVYNYLDAKWNNGGWDTGAYEKLSDYGGPAKATFASSATLGQPGDPAKRLLTADFEVAETAVARFNMPVLGGGLTFTGGGVLEFAGGAVLNGKFNQTGGTLNLGGGTLNIRASVWNNDDGGIPQLHGDIIWENGTIMPDYWTEFRPQEGSNITLAKGAGLYKRSYWRTFIDKGMTLTFAEDAGVTDVPGPFVVTCDFVKDNFLNIHGGTLVVTNGSSTSANGMEHDILIGTQNGKGCGGFLNMTGGKIITRQLCAASGWNADSQGVTSTGNITIGGGTVELLDKFKFGTSSGTRALATVRFNGGEAISPNGILMYADDQDIVSFNGTVFKATADCAKYLNLQKNSGEYVMIEEGGLPIEVAEDKTVALGWGLKGTGGIVKRGAGTLVLDRGATFAGGVDVQAGLLKAPTPNSLGTGILKIADGATAEIVCCADAALAAASAGALKVVLAAGGKQRIIGVESGFALANIEATAWDELGNQIESAVFSVESGALYVTVGGDLTATVAGVNGTWYGLPWMRDGASVSYPSTPGQVVKATILASGSSQVAMNAAATAGKLAMLNDGVGTVFTLTGANPLTANVDLSGFTGEFGVSNVDVLHGTVTMGESSWFVCNVPANEEQSLGDATFSLANSLGMLKKAGGGRLTTPGIMTRPILVDEGVFAMQIDNAESTGALNLTGDGLKEKCGTNVLTVTGGTFGGPFAVTEGQMTVNGSILGMSSLYIGEGAKVYIPHCSQVNNRLPSNGQVIIDGGELHACGVNPFSGAIPEFWVTNGMLRVDCSTGAEHIKFKNIHLKDSTFRLQGLKAAYANNGLFFYSNSGAFFVDGDCVFEFEAESPNGMEAEAAIPLIVSSGSSVVWGIPIMKDVTKTGPGTVKFADTIDHARCTGTFVMREGTLLTGSRVPRINLSAGTTVKALGEDPLVVTTALSLPAAGTIAVDLSAIDFATREDPVRILSYGTFTQADAAKFAFPALPEGWQVVTGAGLQIAKVSQPRDLTWDTGSGEWGDHLWNQDPEGYSVEGYHNVTFKDSTNGTATATAEINVSAAHIVTGFAFNAQNTPYIFSGEGSLAMPSFNGGRVAGFEIGVPLTLFTGGITFATTPYDQEISDIRGPLGAINVPASTGGTAKLGFTNNSQRNPAAITIGTGKTLEICANFTSGASVIPTGAVTGDATTKLRVTAKDCSSHMDLTVDNPDFKGKVEVAEGGFLHVNALLKQVVASEQNPVWAHGAGSVLSIIGNQQNNRFPENGWALIEDGAKFWYRGVNPTKQGECPSLIVSNATVDVGTTSGSHLFLKNLRFYGNCELYLSETTAAYANQGLIFRGDISINTGTTKIFRQSGNPNKFRTMIGDADGAKSIQVAAGALLQLGGEWMIAPIKTGEGSVELLDELIIPGNTFNVAGGVIVVNNKMNNLDGLTVASGCGFDLSAAESCVAMTSGQPPTMSGTVRLVTGERELEKGEYLMRWEMGNSPLNCRYQLVAAESVRARYTLERAGDGVRVGGKSFALFFR